MSDKMATLNIRIDERLRAKFKAQTALNGETMSDALIRMINEYIEQGENKTEY